MEGCEFSRDENSEIQEGDWEDQGQELIRREEDWETEIPEISLHAITGSPNPR
jgi:hypothetical protein